MKQYKRLFLVTAALTLAPMLAGLILWNRLPDTMVTHWGADGVADGWSGKGFAVFVLPLILLAAHCLCALATLIDRKNQEQSRKALRMVFWIMPVNSWFCCGSVYYAATGRGLELLNLVPAFMGLLFAIMGNYMPKVKQNRTLGIKLPWTFANEENWNRTHRYCGRIWVIGGLILMFSIFLPENWAVSIMIPVLAVITLAPILYSLKLYRIHLRQGVVYDFKPKSKKDAVVKRISIAIVSLIIAGTVFLMITGEIDYSFTDSGLEIMPDYWADSFVSYEEMDTVEYRESCDFGVRTNGFGSARLSMGAFSSREFGSYTRYGYTQCKSAVVITSDGRTLVLSAANEADTEMLYELLLEKTK